jgi:hypothetical protein
MFNPIVLFIHIYHIKFRGLYVVELASQKKAHIKNEAKVNIPNKYVVVITINTEWASSLAAVPTIAQLISL